MYDYNNPIRKEEITVIDYSDNGRKKITKFTYGGKFFIQTYNYGQSYGFKFIEEYPTSYSFNNSLKATGGSIIYSTTMQSDCTDFGTFLEYSLMKNDAINPKQLAAQFVILN